MKWVSERSEEFLGASHGRDIRSHAELALDADGRVLALRVHTEANVGAYATMTGVIIQLLIGPWVSTSVYDIQTIDFKLQAVLTNTTPLGAYRGAGRPEAIYIIERLMDAAARKLGLDPAEIRRRNMIRPEQMPYTNPMGQTYDSGKFESVQTQALALADWAGFDARAAQSKKNGKHRGRGMASFLEWTGGNVFEERVTVNVSGDGFIEVFSATQAMGQGIATSYAQLVVDVFGVPIEKVRIVQGDTDRGTGFGSAGSRSIFVGGSAVKVASERTVEKAQALAAEALETAPKDIEYREGVFRVVGTDRQIGLFDLAAQAERRIRSSSIRPARCRRRAGPTPATSARSRSTRTPARSQVASYASVNDVGRAINPTIVIGQLDGGAVQGLGQALCEQVVYERSSGQLQTGTLMDYALPRVDMVKSFKTALDQSTPCLTNPLGVKGVGELGTIGATPAVVNAVVDALTRAGAGERAAQLQMPLLSERVWSALHGTDGLRNIAMNPFAFHRPASVASAVQLRAAQADASYLAGGQSLLPAMKLGLAAPSDLIDLALLPGANGITARIRQPAHRRDDSACRGGRVGRGAARSCRRWPRWPTASATRPCARAARSAAAWRRTTRPPATRPPCWAWAPPCTPTGARSPPTTSSSACTRPRCSRAS